MEKKEVIHAVQSTRKCTDNFLEVAPDLAYGVTMDTKKKSVCLWHLNEIQDGFGELCKTITVPISTSPQTLKLIKSDPKRTRIASGTTNGNVLILKPEDAPILNNVSKNKIFNLPNDHKREVLDLIVSHDGHVIVTTSTDQTVIWRRVNHNSTDITEEGNEQAVKTFRGHNDKVHQLLLCTPSKNHIT